MEGPRPRPLATLGALALLMALIAGCVDAPSTETRVHPGDLVRAALVVWNEGGTVFPVDRAGERAPACDATSCAAAGDPRAYVLGSALPREVPTGWEDAQLLPPGAATALLGAAEGTTVHAADVFAFGMRNEGLLVEHPRAGAVTRFVAGHASYGPDLAGARLDNGTLFLTPTEGDRGALLDVPRWCNERFCLLRSTLAAWNDTHLLVRHEPDEGAQASVPALSTFLAVRDVTQDSFLVDGNHPRAGETFTVHARVDEVRAAPGSTQRAPDFEIVTLDGDRVRLVDVLGRPVVIEFFASWCPSCIQNVPHLRRLQEEHGEHVRILAISVDPWEDPRDLAAWGDKYGVTWPMAIDPTGDLARDYRVGALSTEMVLTPDGAIARVETGVADHAAVSRLVGDLSGHPAEATG